jgi:hypothetical protein
VRERDTGEALRILDAPFDNAALDDDGMIDPDATGLK